MRKQTAKARKVYFLAFPYKTLTPTIRIQTCCLENVSHNQAFFLFQVWV